MSASAEWKETKLGAVSSKITKGTTPTTLGFNFSSSGINFVKVEAITDDGRLRQEKFAHIDEKTNSALGRSTLQPNDILFSIAGAIGRSALVKKEILPANINQAVAVIRPNTRLVNPEFLALQLQDKEIVRFVNSIVAQSVQANINLQQLSDLTIVLPGLKEQQEITRVLASLDDKIELLRQQNETLEQIAQSLYTEWFIKPLSHGIPNGWAISNLFSIAEVLSGGTPATGRADFYGGEIPFFTPKDAGDATYVLETEKHLTESGLENCNSILYPLDTIFITARGTVGKVVLTGVPMAMNQSCYALRAKDERNQFLVYLLLKEITRDLLGRTHGSVFQTITLDTFRGIDVPVADEQTLISFRGIVRPLFLKIRRNTMMSRTLSTIREALLPRLMNGSIRVAS